jgi:nucleolar protein 6
VPDDPIGNLPYSVTKEQLQKHFEKITPKDIRVMTDKVTKKSKGFAFLEFEHFDRMETCLKMYHHSMFGEGKKARKINVELT